ncbi:hypothetical protein KP509_14G030800 [Ceratopteris richardii]|uniref:Uncharacterized protein n=1 Tax=Ceratopteris richardii TaxID=49495 RepID=A0A8T2TAK9_CERRI|nr:hypothetical protein KP509_14G030800 [Ceratopteris richardii]
MDPSRTRNKETGVHKNGGIKNSRLDVGSLPPAKPLQINPSSPIIVPQIIHRILTTSDSSTPVCSLLNRINHTTVEPIIHGDICRRTLFSKSIGADDDSHTSGKRFAIEDYMDPYLLMQASKKLKLFEYKQSNAIGNRRSRLHSEYSQRVNSFQWPSEELQAMTNRSEQLPSWWRVDAASDQLSDSFHWPSSELRGMLNGTSSNSGNFTCKLLNFDRQCKNL